MACKGGMSFEPFSRTPPPPLLVSLDGDPRWVDGDPQQGERGGGGFLRYHNVCDSK